MREPACKGNVDRAVRPPAWDRRTLAIPASVPVACDIAHARYFLRRDGARCRACGPVAQIPTDGRESTRGDDRPDRKILWRTASARNRRREIAARLRGFRARRL